ncbi:hypothetical protein [Demequina aurantiaca]|uniref:hypothetical protein n=1 Tax=Demequina aurantiaca TaxID=676200 RepID=UPI003D33FDFD
MDAPHEIYFDSTLLHGYGSVDTINLLAGDPSLYPDTNPLLEEDGIPSPAELTGTASLSPSPSASPTSTPLASAQPSDALSSTPAATASASKSTGTPGWLAPSIIALVVLLVIGGTVVTLVILENRKRESA